MGCEGSYAPEQPTGLGLPRDKHRISLMGPRVIPPWPEGCSKEGHRFSSPSQPRLGENVMVPAILDNKGTKILAKSLFKELRGNGYSTNQILSLSTELIDLVTQGLKDEHAQAAAAALAAAANEARDEHAQAAAAAQAAA